MTLKRPFLSCREVAELLGISQGQIYKLIKRGFLPYIMVGKRSMRIHFNDLKVLAPNYVPPLPPKGDA
jgi:excisionase family DNA binding protein